MICSESNDRVWLRVQCHAHACIFGWLLGDCISETIADKESNTYATRLAGAVHNKSSTEECVSSLM